MFPKAKFYVGKEAFERAQNPHLRDRASFIDGLQEVLINSGRLILLDENSSEKPFEDCEFIFTNGHTIGQMHCLISHKNEKFFFAGDLIPAKEWLHLPVAMGYDRCAETLVDEKLILDRAINEKWKILYTHDLNTAMSEVFINAERKV